MQLNNLNVRLMTRNDCYVANKKIIPKGIMIHSTATPGIRAKMWFERWNKSYKLKEINRQVCVHAFVDDVEIWQYLPWNHRGWHAGGAANNTHIGIELCEPSGFSYSGANMIGYNIEKHENYFKKTFENAVKLCIFLCKEYNLTEKDVICHREGFKKSIASNHMDIMHWFPRHNENMDSFRLSVRDGIKKYADEKIGQNKSIEIDNSDKNSARYNSDVKYYRVQVGAFSKKENAIELMNRLKKSGFDSYLNYN